MAGTCERRTDYKLPDKIGGMIMSTINNKEVVKEQYKNASNLNTRISIHSKYSTNKQGFGNWIVAKYDIKDKMRVLELGCGIGDMWKDHMELLNTFQAF